MLTTTLPLFPPAPSINAGVCTDKLGQGEAGLAGAVDGRAAPASACVDAGVAPDVAPAAFAEADVAADPLALHPALWRASQLARAHEQCIDTGYRTLSQQLPGGGWPTGNLVDLMVTSKFPTNRPT